MTLEKYESEVKTLKKFFEIYCGGKKHSHETKKTTLTYKGVDKEYSFELCDECFELINYSFEKLNDCPHDPKPRCRTCPNPCYEKSQWKSLAKVMKYSGMRLGLLKIKKLFK